MEIGSVDTVGVLGAGTMGSGIALTALSAGYRVALIEISDEVRDRAQAYLRGHLERKGLQAAMESLKVSSELAELNGCQVVIEAVPEDLDLKQSLFQQLDRVCPPPAILATNTSTLSATAIAATTSAPWRVAAMHFFNPAAVMPLVEVASAAQTAPETRQALVELAQALGKTPVVTKDTPGFIVNRVARPFYGEALRMLGEGVAEHQEIDFLARHGAGFRMGPFELMDLIGVDVNFAAVQSMYRASFGEPRYRPHWIQEHKVNQGALGRKTGEGFYRYAEGQRVGHDPELPSARGGSGYVLLSEGSWAPGVSDVFAQAGYSLSETHGDLPILAIVASGREEGAPDLVRRLDRRLGSEVPLLCQMADLGWSELAQGLRAPERLIGFDGLFFADGTATTLVRSPYTAEATAFRVDELVRGLGKLTIWIGESPGLVLPRVVCCLANEAAFAVLEGVAEAESIDQAMQLGVNYPHGPLAWAQKLGYGRVLDVLDHLHREYGEERYRAAPTLRRWARIGFH